MASPSRSSWMTRIRCTGEKFWIGCMGPCESSLTQERGHVRPGRARPIDTSSTLEGHQHCLEVRFSEQRCGEVERRGKVLRLNDIHASVTSGIEEQFTETPLMNP